MPEIHAFRGLRYDLGHVGALSDVVAPPYDVIDGELQEALYRRHPANVIRLILNRDEPGDDDQENRYSRAARFLRNWVREGVLAHEADPALYVYHQVFTFDDVQYTRRGFMARARLQRFGEGTVYPHEETHAAAKADRLKLTTACKANLSQIFGLYPDSQNDTQKILESVIAAEAPVEATDHLGVIHRLWPVTDVSTIAQTVAQMTAKPIFVADGHHRYETACNYRDQLAEAGALAPDHAANFVLMMCVSMSDDGMIVLPTHRLFQGVPSLSSTELTEKLGTSFAVEPAGHGPSEANQVWEQIAVEDRQTTIGLYCQADQQWLLVRITPEGQARMAQLAPDHSAHWQGLGVAVLHRLIVEDALGCADLPKPTYVHQVSEVETGLTDGDATGTPYPLAALVMPATLDHIRAISEHNERMPAKSTYFYPKLLSGLVINPVE